MKNYTIDDARREVKECFDEGYGYGYVRIFLNDLARGKDITWEECNLIKGEIITGKFGDLECSIGTF